MDLLAPASTQVQQRTIPLVCNICASQPHFSDLSHLLTHISSKAHLSTYYRGKVRASSDEAIRQSIEHYDIWYAENDIEAFMSKRMKQKEDVKRQKIKNGTYRCSSRVLSSLLTRNPAEPYSKQKVIKKESDSPTVIPSSMSLDDTASVYPSPFAAYAPMYSWAAHPFLYPSKQEETSVDQEDQHIPSNVMLMAAKHKAKAQTPHTGEVDDDDTSKLKGIVWPGMGLFDAATPELKKKRNQKKDVSVNDRLAAMSEVIQKEEMVFSPAGSLRKVRPISGQLQSEDDLLSGEELPPRPPKAKRAPRKKSTEDKKSVKVEKPAKEKKSTKDRNSLKDMDTNTSKDVTARPKAKKRGRKQQSVPAIAQETQEEQHTEDELTRDAGRNKRKRGSFYHDEEGEEEDDTMIDTMEATFEQPAVMAHLTSGYPPGPMYVAAAPMGFRAAEPTYMNMNMGLNLGMMGQSYYQFPAGNENQPSYEPAPLTTWDYYGYGISGSIANPLFSGMYGGSFGDDDEDNEGTISAPISESDK